MGEQKRRAAAGHVPPPDMMNASGKVVKALAQDIADRAAMAVNRDHLDMVVMFGCVLSVAVDMMRANGMPDNDVRSFTNRFVEQRLTRPSSYWGAHSEKEDG